MSKNTKAKTPPVAQPKQVAPKLIQATHVVSPEVWTQGKYYYTEPEQPDFPEILYVKNDKGKVVALYNWDTTKRHLNNFVEAN